MNGGSPEQRRRGPAGRIASACLIVLLLAACTGGGREPASEEARAPAAVPNQLPDATVAATDPPRPAVLDVVLSFAGWDDRTASVEGAGYVSPRVEDGGTCTLELAQDGRSVEVTAEGRADASTTVCAGLRVPRERLAPGVWTVVLRYTSPTSQGSAEPLTVEVPQ